MKSNILFIFMLIINILPNINLYSVDWTQYTPPPCNPDPLHPWQGPKEMRLCPTDIPDCNTECCVTIIYYDRWTGTNNREYELSIVGAFLDNNQACDNCIDFSTETIIRNAYFNLIVAISKADKQFKTKVINNGVPAYGNDAGIYVYVPAKCIAPDSMECNINHRCCKTWSGVIFVKQPLDSQHIVRTIDFPCSLYEVTIPCEPPSDCLPLCFQLSKGYHPGLCEYLENCADGYWFQKTKQIEIWGCNDCIVNFTYQWRQNERCEPTIYEYKIMYWQQSPACDYCYGGANQIYDGMINWLLENGPITEAIEDGQCRSDVRITNPTCWDIRDWPEPNTWAECPDNVACCFRRYQICRDSLGNLMPPVLIDFNGYLQQCAFPCTAICGNFPTIYLPDEPTAIKDEVNKLNQTKCYIVPNPNDGNFTLYINSEMNGNVRLEIYNIIGDFMQSEEILKNSNNFNHTIEVSKLPANQYYIKISIDGLLFDTLKMIIKK